MRDIEDIIRTRDERQTDFMRRFESDLESWRRLGILSAALETGILEHFQEPCDPRVVSESMGLDAVIAPLFTECLIHIGLLEQRTEGLVVSDTARQYLLQASPCQMSIHLANRMKRLEDLVRLPKMLHDGPLPKERTQEWNEKWMEGIAQSCRDGQVGEFVRLCGQHIDLDRCHRMLDLGGGHGLYSIAFAHLHPGLECTVMDLPVIVPYAQKTVDEYGSRVKVVVGDYFRDPLPEGNDVILSSFSRCGSEPALVEKVRDALRPHGHYVIRRHRAHTSEDPMENLEWNMISFPDRKPGSKKWEFGTQPPVDEYLACLREVGFDILYHDVFDGISEVVIARRR